MPNMQVEIMVAVAGILITALLVVHLIVHCRLFERKAKLQEDLVNIYTPDILKGTVAGTPELTHLELKEVGSKKETE